MLQHSKDCSKNQVFMERWMKMAEEGRMAVIDRTFDAMTQQVLPQLNLTKRAYIHRRTN